MAGATRQVGALRHLICREKERKREKKREKKERKKEREKKKDSCNLPCPMALLHFVSKSDRRRAWVFIKTGSRLVMGD